MKTKGKRKKNKVTILKNRLARLNLDIAAALTEVTKHKLLLQVIETEAALKIEAHHQLTGFNRVSRREILAGAPGLGKRS